MDKAAAPQVLWRMQGPTKVVTAALIDRASAGIELRVFFEPEATGDLLSRQVEEQRRRVRLLERRADRLRKALLDQGWVDLPIAGSNGTEKSSALAIGPSIRRLLKAGALGLGLVTVAGWGWHQRAAKRERPEP